MINLSVCCCTYNRPEFLGEFIHSYLLQKYPLKHRELIILDDGGQYGNCSGEGWQLISFPRRFSSLGEKRNACVSLCSPRADAIVIADDDDIYFPHWLECHAKNFEKGAKWSFASSIFWSENNKIITQWHYRDEDWIMHPAHAFTKKLFWEVGGYPHISWQEDKKLFQKFTSAGYSHMDALGEDGFPYMICRRNITFSHIHTNGMSLESYQNNHSSVLNPCNLSIKWRKDYLKDAAEYKSGIRHQIAPATYH